MLAIGREALLPPGAEPQPVPAMVKGEQDLQVRPAEQLARPETLNPEPGRPANTEKKTKRP